MRIYIPANYFYRYLLVKELTTYSYDIPFIFIKQKINIIQFFWCAETGFWCWRCGLINLWLQHSLR